MEIWKDGNIGEEQIGSNGGREKGGDTGKNNDAVSKAEGELERPAACFLSRHMRDDNIGAKRRAVCSFLACSLM